ncbi:hypothetical protein ACPX19_11305 [Winogradskyella sp. HB-48]|uniref:hypothetical protein n=1 Tax=Winogradskyella sp. HB-48 TaxID=3416808 RepID=UPI003CF9F266
MKKALYITLVFSILSCSNSKKSDSLESEQNKTAQIQVEENIEKRFLYDFFVDSLKRKMEYELTKKIKDSSIIYHYKNLTDSEKNLNFKFLKKTNQLFFAGTEFRLIKENHYSNKSLSEFNFDLYVLVESMDDGNGPMFFNPEYGILNLDNGWGMDLIFLKNEQKTELVKEINKTLKEKTFYNTVYN